MALKGSLQEEFSAVAPGRVRFDEPMRFHTTFHLGGPAEIWAEPQNEEELRRLLLVAREAGFPVTAVGGGANLLVRDEGIPGLVVHLVGAGFQIFSVHPEHGRRGNEEILVGAALPLEWLIRRAQQEGLSGVEFLAGVPGRVGGAARMNAGTHDPQGRTHSFGDVVESVRVMDHAGQTLELKAEELRFGYRSSGIDGQIVLEAVLHLAPDDPEEIAGRVRRLWEFKKQTQDWSAPSVGCIFKNPAPAACRDSAVPAAGWMIEQVGLKGCRLGGAMVSTQHANFIMNTGSASASDVLNLIGEARERVLKRFEVHLELEVQVIP